MRDQRRRSLPKWRGVAVRAVILGALVASIGSTTASAQRLETDSPWPSPPDRPTNTHSDGPIAHTADLSDPISRWLPYTTAEAAIVVDRTTGAILGGKDHDLRWAPASTTKIMTALLTVEAINAGQISLDSTVVVQADVDIEPGSGDVGLAAGDRVSVRDLLNMAMLGSANDAAVALGTYVGGSRDAFVAMMNSRARQLGLSNTSYVDISGRDPEDLNNDGRLPAHENCDGNDFMEAACAHYSTARDLAALARVALDEPLFATLAQRTNWRTTTWRRDRLVLTRGLSTTNQLLPGGTNPYTGAYGVKTGTTDLARENLVSAARNAGPGGKDVIAVVLGSDDDPATTANRYTDSTTLLDWALERTP
jgi:D-alanyl-D-alanine carboxypeptidase